MSCNCQRKECPECSRRELVGFAKSGGPGSFDAVILQGVKDAMLHGFALCAQIADHVAASCPSVNGQQAARRVAKDIREKADAVLRERL